MLLIRPYGRSRVGKERRRKLVVTQRTGHTKQDARSIRQFVTEDHKILIAQWISVIDKIFRKPSVGKKPTQSQFNARKELGRECWRILHRRHFSKLDGKELERLKGEWAWKLHPYGSPPKSYETKRPQNTEGRWFKTFLGEQKVDGVDFSKLAKQIEDHLYASEIKIDGSPRDVQSAKGLMAARAKSIENCVLPQLDELEEIVWRDEEKDAFLAQGDLAREIYLKNAELEQEKKKRKISSKEAGSIIFEHYGRQFTRSDGGVLSRDEISKNQGPLLALYDAVRSYYKVLLRTSKKSSLTYSLPQNGEQLFKLLQCKHKNRTVNDLIRLGRVMHYENTEGDEDGFGIDAESKVWNEDALKQSRYWTSEGQASIKRAEAFVRVWRNTISQANRTLKTWADPEEKRHTDIFADAFAKELRTNNWDVERARSHADVLFGSRARLFDEPVDFADLVHTTLRVTARCRNQVFHFRGRKSFVAKLKDALGDRSSDPLGAPLTRERIKRLYLSDIEESKARLIATCKAANLDRYATQEQLNDYVSLIEDTTETDTVLPRYNRMLLRLENTRQLRLAGSEHLYLPKPGNSADLENQALLAKHTGCKLAYDGPFRAWLASQPTTFLNHLIDEVVTRGTREARKINSKDPHSAMIEAKAERIGRLSEGEGLSVLFERLSAETASEMRVQKAYESSAENAQKQAAWIEAFRCDVVGRAFREYVADRNLAWLISLSEKTNPAAVPATVPDPAPLPSDRQPEQWLANAYLMLHMVPVDDVARLLHQFRKWGVLQNKSEDAKGEFPDPDIAALGEVLALYLKMHDAKFDGSAVKLGLEPFRKLYADGQDFDELFLSKDATTDRLAGTRRGLREIMRFGHLPVLESICGDIRISKEAVAQVLKMEDHNTKSGSGFSEIAQAQRERKTLHKKAVQTKSFTKDDLKEYRRLQHTIVTHRQLANQAKLTNHLGLHRLLMRIIARLVDYAGLWERDLYFISLALMKTTGKNPADVFLNKEARGQFQKQGKVIVSAMSDDFKSQLQKYANISDTHREIRNDFDHLNVLAKSNLPVSLTDQINRTRKLMSYDRKLKNAVSKSIKELMFENGIIVDWKVEDHELCHPQVRSRSITHLSDVCKKFAGDEIRRLGLSKDQRREKMNIRKKYEISEPFHDGQYIKLIHKLLNPE